LAALAETCERPIAPRDCTRPVLLVANPHLVFAAENALILKTLRYRGSYRRGYSPQLISGLALFASGAPGVAQAAGRPRR
jgi:galactonate dehydratase